MGGCRVVKWEGEERWAIEKNSSMFAPTFREQLPAMMFAEIYQRMTLYTDPNKWTDAGQELIATELNTFLDEKMPEGDRNRRHLPVEWMQAIFTAKYGDDDEETKAEFAKGFRYSYDDLVEDAEVQWKRGHVKVLDMVIEWFHLWQAEIAAKKGKS